MIILITILLAFAAGIFAKTAMLWRERNHLKEEAEILRAELQEELRQEVLERKDLWHS